jgi:asparagine synthase (glutamine-hydrolysing)
VRRASARTPREQQLSVLAPGLTANGALYHELGAAYGIELRDPTADIRLAEFCLGIPRDQYFRGRQSRWLVRRAMEGLLPPAVQWNTRRGIQSADVTTGVLAELDRIAQEIARVEASSLAQRYLSMPLLRQLWSELQQPDLAQELSSGYYLIGMLAVGRFLIREEERLIRHT